MTLRRCTARILLSLVGLLNATAVHLLDVVNQLIRKEENDYG